jgi:hypothetical protein
MMVDQEEKRANAAATGPVEISDVYTCQIP